MPRNELMQALERGNDGLLADCVAVAVETPHSALACAGDGLRPSKTDRADWFRWAAAIRSSNACDGKRVATGWAVVQDCIGQGFGALKADGAVLV